jgi:hypothetical protein
MLSNAQIKWLASIKNPEVGWAEAQLEVMRIEGKLLDYMLD